MPPSFPPASSDGFHHLSETSFGVSIGHGRLTPMAAMRCDASAYIHPGYAFCEFIGSPVSPATQAPGDEHESDDISGSPLPPSSSPIAYQEPVRCEGETEETTLRSPFNDFTSSTYHLGSNDASSAKAISTNNSGHQQARLRLLIEPLDCLSHIIGVDIPDTAAPYDCQANTTSFVQFLEDPSPSSEIKMDKKLVARSSMPSLISLGPLNGVRVLNISRSVLPNVKGLARLRERLRHK